MGKSRFPSNSGFKTDSPANIQQWEGETQSVGIICPSVSKNVVLYSLTASSHVIKHSPNEGLGKMDFILRKEPISCTAG